MSTTAGGGRPEGQETAPLMAPATELQMLALTMARVEAKLDTLTSTKADHEARLRTVEAFGCKDHGDRIAALERWRWLSIGAAAAMGAGADHLAGLFTG